MPPKIRQLKASLAQAGFYMRSGKGSHTIWKHRAMSGVEITLSGNDGDDAKPYQIKNIQQALKKLGEKP